MAELVPASLPDLVARIYAEHRAQDAIFDLPRRSFWMGDPDRDHSVSFHGDLASTPIGPAAGPQSQLSQNIVLAWLGGARIIELKTVQRNDQLVIPRPCIDARTVGYNVEWSQELRLHDSLSEYVNAWMLIALLRASGLPSAQAAGPQGETLFDFSVGYDLAGLTSAPIRQYLDTLLDARAAIDARRPSLPARYRDIEIDPRIARSVTLSTFHGCPADEIERICEVLLNDVGIHTVVKLNPTLLGLDTVTHLLHDVMGYRHVTLDPSAFEHDLRFPDAIAMLARLRALAAKRGLGFGVKLTNTLVTKNTDTYFREPTMYLSGQPLYVLATALADKLRAAVGPTLPMSFSAGIDAHNVADAALMGMVPITMCTDLLRPGGYARLSKYMTALSARMREVGAATRDAFVLNGLGHGAEARAWAQAQGPADTAALEHLAVAKAAAMNLAVLAPKAAAEPRYGHARNSKLPRKIGSSLQLFDCISCDKCVPVCPNDANFVYETQPRELRLDVLRFAAGALREEPGERVRVERRHQLANFADFCNECGNCDVFCPEDGGPFIEKPRFFSREHDFSADARTMGFFLSREDETTHRLLGRIAGRTYMLRLDARRGLALGGDGLVEVCLTPGTGALRSARALGEVPEGHTLPLGPLREMLTLLEGVLDVSRPTPINVFALRPLVDALLDTRPEQAASAAAPPVDPAREHSIC